MASPAGAGPAEGRGGASDEAGLARKRAQPLPRLVPPAPPLQQKAAMQVSRASKDSLAPPSSNGSTDKQDGNGGANGSSSGDSSSGSNGHAEDAGAAAGEGDDKPAVGASSSGSKSSKADE